MDIFPHFSRRSFGGLLPSPCIAIITLAICFANILNFVFALGIKKKYYQIECNQHSSDHCHTRWPVHRSDESESRLVSI